MKAVYVHARRRDAEIVFDVSDDGVGLTRDEVLAARERFRTVSPTSGSGLGVSIVEAIAKGHEGVLTLNPQKQGLLVELRLPIIAEQRH